MIQISGPLFRRTLLFLTLAELFSLTGYLFPEINTITFFVLTGLALVATLIKLEYGVLLAFAELFTGSKGFLFFLSFDGAILSLRMALWLILLGVWAAQFLLARFRKEPLDSFFSSRTFHWYLTLAFFVIVGIGNAFLRGNALQAVALDVNAWFYFLLLFPFLSVLKTKEQLYRVLTVLCASALFTSLKALFLLFIFAHDPLHSIYGPLYRWLRHTGGGEATIISPTFIRVFLQSQLYTLIAFFLLFVEKGRQNDRLRSWFMLSAMLASILLSFSRSFWVGGLSALALAFLVVGWRKFFSFLLLASVAIGMILLVIHFPYPKSLGGDFLFLFEKRVTETEESAVGSRWNLLPPLWESISEAPIVGKGFGTTVTYRSNDPRIVQSTARGSNFYTTYAFEWGYLDIWLKIGLLGLFVYLYLIWKIVKEIQNSEFRIQNFGLLLGLLVLLVTNIFSPYLNHPLGIGYILLLTAFSQHFASQEPPKRVY